MSRLEKCPVCGSEASLSADYETGLAFYECPTCGRFELKALGVAPKFDFNHLASYLVYHRFSREKVIEYRYHHHSSINFHHCKMDFFTVCKSLALCISQKPL